MLLEAIGAAGEQPAASRAAHAGTQDRTGQDRMMMMMTMTMMTMMTMVMTTTMMTMTMMMMTMMMMMLCNHVMHMDCLATATQLVTSGMAVTVTCMSCPVTVCLVNRHPCTVHCCDGPSTL